MNKVGVVVENYTMSLLNALQHLGFTIPAYTEAGWIGKVMPDTSYLDEKLEAKNNCFTNRNNTLMT